VEQSKERSVTLEGKLAEAEDFAKDISLEVDCLKLSLSSSHFLRLFRTRALFTPLYHLAPFLPSLSPSR
jgi:methylphosphotriester-DNA--protein-cysteine methyltransferase